MEYQRYIRSRQIERARKLLDGTALINTKERISAHFMICYTALTDTFDLWLDKKYYQPKELNKKLKTILGLGYRFHSD